MNIIHRIHQLTGILAASGCALLALAAASPAMATTMSRPHYGPSVPSPVPAQVYTTVAGGMPAWQIALIAVGSAACAAVLAVTADRARTTRRHTTAPSS